MLPGRRDGLRAMLPGPRVPAADARNEDASCAGTRRRERDGRLKRFGAPERMRCPEPRIYCVQGAATCTGDFTGPPRLVVRLLSSDHDPTNTKPLLVPFLLSAFEPVFWPHNRTLYVPATSVASPAA